MSQVVAILNGQRINVDISEVELSTNLSLGMVAVKIRQFFLEVRRRYLYDDCCDYYLTRCS